MTFPLEKILNINYKDYCDSEGAEPEDYEMYGVHAFRSEIAADASNYKPVEDLALKADELQLILKKEIEAVINYKVTPFFDNALRYCYEVSAVALVYREKEEEQIQKL